MLILDDLRTKIKEDTSGKLRKQEILYFHLIISYGTERTMGFSSEERRNRKEHRMLLDIYQLKP